MFFPTIRENCRAVQDLFCYDEWIQVEENKQRGIYFNNRGHFRLPNCSGLPSVSEDGVCTEVDLFSITPEKLTSKAGCMLKMTSVG